MAGIFKKIAGFLGWEEKFSFSKTLVQLMVLYLVVPIIVLLVRLLLPKLSELMVNELLPTLVGDILSFIVKVLTIISDGMRKAFAGMSRITVSRGELIDALEQLRIASGPIRNMNSVYSGALLVFVGVLSGTVQAWYMTMAVMLSETLLRMLNLTDRLKLIFNVAGLFIGCLLWELYGGQYGNLALMFAGLIFLILLNFVLQMVFLGMSWIKAGLSVFIGMLCTAVSGCYLSVLEHMYLFGVQSLTECVIMLFVSGGVLVLISLLSQYRSGLF